MQATTTGGLAFYRQSTNTPTFTDGFNHWALTGDGLIAWTGSAIDPPGNTAVAPPVPTAAPTTSKPVPPTVSAEPIFDTRKGPKTISQLRDELARAGYDGPWDVPSILTAYDRATAPPLGPAFQGQLPSSCDWGLLGSVSVYFCVYPSGAGASWQDASRSAVLIAFTPPGGSVTFTDARKRILGLADPAPAHPALPAPPVVRAAPQPSDSDLLVTMGSIGGISRSLPTVSVQICN
jgi:hypothetical protein